MSRYWSSGLFGCFGDCGVCIITYLLPCVTAGRNARAVDKSCLMHGLSVFVPILYCICATNVRAQIREERGIIGGKGGDCISHIFCPLCALAQEARELKTPSSSSMARN